MPRRLARIASRFRKSEKVGRAQLVLFLDALPAGVAMARDMGARGAVGSGSDARQTTSVESRQGRGHRSESDGALTLRRGRN